MNALQERTISGLLGSGNNECTARARRFQRALRTLEAAGYVVVPDGTFAVANPGTSAYGGGYDLDKLVEFADKLANG